MLANPYFRSKDNNPSSFFVMIHKIKLVLIFLFVLSGMAVFPSCHKPPVKRTEKKQKNLLTTANWLLGSWEHKEDQSYFYEAWQQSNDTLYSGISYLIKAGDTVLKEVIRLEQQQKHLVYIPTALNQNNDQPVPFTMTSASNRQLVFENPTHDFPQKIRYRLIRKDSIVAEISGRVKGEIRQRQFPMKKVR